MELSPSLTGGSSILEAPPALPMLSTVTKLRIARLLYLTATTLRRPFGGKDLVEVSRRGVRWRLDLREGIDLTIYLAGAFEPNTLRCLEQNVRPGATVLDIGANVGAHTLHLARLAGPAGHVFAFEPTAFAFDKLRANLGLNPGLATRVSARQVFLVSRDGEKSGSSVASSWPVDGRMPDDAVMGSRSMDVTGSACLTVDAVMAEAGNPEVQLIKMDVDGHELDVLNGARALLTRSRPTIVMELAPYAFNPRDDFDRMVSLLLDLGYTLRPLHSKRPLPRDLAQLRRLVPARGSMNVVAVPPQEGGEGACA